MVKSKNGAAKVSYSVRIKPEYIAQLKHLAVDENKATSELIEEGIKMVLDKRKEKKAVK